MSCVPFRQRGWRRRLPIAIGLWMLVLPVGAAATQHESLELSYFISASVSEWRGNQSTILDRYSDSATLSNPDLTKGGIRRETPTMRGDLVIEIPRSDGFGFDSVSLIGDTDSDLGADRTRAAAASRAQVIYAFTGEEESEGVGPQIGAGTSTRTRRTFFFRPHPIPGFGGTIPARFVTRLNGRATGTTGVTVAGGASPHATGWGTAWIRVSVQMQWFSFPNTFGPTVGLLSGLRTNRVDIEGAQMLFDESRTGVFAGDPAPEVELSINRWYRVRATLETSAGGRLRGSGRITATADAGNSLLLFPYGEEVFLGLPESVTVSAPAAGIVDNRFRFPGDANLDARVDVEDLEIVAIHWHQGGADWQSGDFDGNGVVDLADLELLAANWLEGIGEDDGDGMAFAEALSLFEEFDGVVVPEPGPLPTALAALATLGGLAGRRRSRRERRTHRSRPLRHRGGASDPRVRISSDFV